MIGLFLLHKTSLLPLPPPLPYPFSTLSSFLLCHLFYSVIFSTLSSFPLCHLFHSVILSGVEGPRECVRQRNNGKAFSPRTRSPRTQPVHNLPRHVRRRSTA